MAGPNILLTRIDNRLVHGQVGVTWVGSLGANLLLVANDAAATDPIQQNLMDMVVAEGVQTRYFTLQKTIDVIHKAASHQKIFPAATLSANGCSLITLHFAVESCRLLTASSSATATRVQNTKRASSPRAAAPSSRYPASFPATDLSISLRATTVRAVLRYAMHAAINPPSVACSCLIESTASSCTRGWLRSQPARLSSLLFGIQLKYPAMLLLCAAMQRPGKVSDNGSLNRKWGLT